MLIKYKQTFRAIFCSLALSLLTLLAVPPVAQAACASNQQSCSSTYGVGEAFFGNGGELNACGTQYCAKEAAGETGVGNTAGSAYQAQAGFNTNREEYLEFDVNTSSIDFGVLSPSGTGHGNATFSVKSYLSSGYIVQTVGAPPTNSGHALSPITSAAASSAGSEQFGMNLVNNLTTCATPAPLNFGADPVQVPDSSFSFGQAATGYNTCGKFQYNNGDTIASSNKSSGETDYTISYIANVSGVTPGGQYRMDQSLVATATF